MQSFHCILPQKFRRIQKLYREGHLLVRVLSIPEILLGQRNPSHMFFCELYEIFVISNFCKVSKYNDITMIFIALNPNLGPEGRGGAGDGNFTAPLLLFPQ